MGMYDQALRELAGLHRQLSRVDDAFLAPEPAAPARAQGSDRSGTIHAVLSRDGTPEAFRVDQGWQRAVGAAGFADAVAEASTAAHTGSGPDGDGWSDRLHQALTGEAPDRSAASEVEALFAPGGRTRQVQVYLDEALRYTGAADARLDSARLATGTAAGGRLALFLAPMGSVSCEVDPDWLARQEAEDLTEALNRALAAARAELYAEPAGRKPWQG